MRPILVLLILTFGFCRSLYAQAPVDPTQALRANVDFINHSVEEVERMIKGLRVHYAWVQQWKTNKNTAFGQALAPSGAVEEFYYRKVLEKQHGQFLRNAASLHDQTQKVWLAFQQLDKTYKALEVYLRLGDYKTDDFQQSETLISTFQRQLVDFRKEKAQLSQLVQQLYESAQSAEVKNPYAIVGRQMRNRLQSEETLLALWNENFHEATPTGWPVEAVQAHVNASEIFPAQFSKAPAGIAYPASSEYASFGAALASLQTAKRDGIDQFNHQARQSDRHGNAVYQNLINHYNNDLLGSYNQFVLYSRQAGQYLLPAAKFCPMFEIRKKSQVSAPSQAAFEETPIPALEILPQKAPISASAFTALDHSVEFINESLREITYLQQVLRNYQSSANYYKTLTSFKKKGALQYNHDDFTLPQSLYQQARLGTEKLPQRYRPALEKQLEGLLNMQQEMDALSIELGTYAKEKRYETDRFKRHDAILGRYVTLFAAFDQRKQRLYEDLRRIFESYLPKQSGSAWYVSGKSLLQTFDENHTALLGVRDFLTGQKRSLPSTQLLEARARALITDEYQQMNGLKRYGRNNGLCPYTPYEDLAENSRRFSAKVNQVKPTGPVQAAKPYEEFIWFYNNELVYPYNKFCELSPVKLLKQIKQPFLFVLTPPESAGQPASESLTQSGPPPEPVKPASGPVDPPASRPVVERTERVIHDTVFVEKIRVDKVVDTVYVPQPTESKDFWSMDGFAYNNMVLLLDVSASMNAPHKLPLLKKSVKRLLQILRPEDEVSIVVYSGKAKVLMQPTSAREIGKISRIIDELESEGNTDANTGIKLAYQVADKNYLRGGNNRIILATDGEFSISPSIFELVTKNARQDIHLSVFDFTRGSQNAKTHILHKLAENGKGSFEIILPENSDVKLVQEAKAKRQK